MEVVGEHEVLDLLVLPSFHWPAEDVLDDAISGGSLLGCHFR